MLQAHVLLDTSPCQQCNASSPTRAIFHQAADVYRVSQPVYHLHITIFGPLYLLCTSDLLCFRDRLYEAGFEESVDLSRLHSIIPQLPADVATSDFARYAGVAVIAGLGAAGFAAGAVREQGRIKRVQILDK